MQTFQRKRILLAVSGLLFAIFMHIVNGKLSNLPFGLHETADDASYMAPAWNFTDTGSWKDNTTGESSYIQRPPMMGIFHTIGFLTAGKNGPVIVMCFAFLLHGMAILGLSGIFRRFLTEKQALYLTAIYAFLPCFWGFLSYSITESVSSSFIVLTFYAALSGKKFSPAITIVLFTICWLLRPVLVLLFPLVIYQIVKKRKLLFSRLFLLNGALLVICLLSVFLWEKRKADHIGSWFDLHPIYHETNQTMFRPVHKDLSNLFRIWETKPEDFHNLTGYCWNNEPAENDPVIDHYYNEHTIPLERIEFEQLMAGYSRAEHEIAKTFGRKVIRESDSEKELSTEIRKATATARSGAKTLYYFGTPLKSAKEMLSKSQLNLEIFQEHLKGNIVIEIIRYVSLGVILLSCLFSLTGFFTRNTELLLMATGIFLYLFYLFFIQRMCEDRYMLPAMPVMLICGFASVLLLYNRKKSLS